MDLTPYIQFIESCRHKVYEPELAIHAHHIVPRYQDNESTEVVNLSVEDHIQAHIILANCYDVGSKDWIANLHSARLLQKNSKKYREELLKVYEHLKGDNNPSKRLDVREKISKALKARSLKGIQSDKKFKSYEELYGDNAELEKRKRAKCTRSKEEYAMSAKKSSETVKQSKKLAKGNNPAAKKVKINGQIFDCVSDAFEHFKMSRYKLKKLYKFEYLNFD
jgi:hypothetical protein